MGRESGPKTRTETGVGIWDAFRSPKPEQKSLSEFGMHFGPAVQKPVPESGPFFFPSTASPGRCVTFQFRFFLGRKMGRFSVPEIIKKTLFFHFWIFRILFCLGIKSFFHNLNFNHYAHSKIVFSAFGFYSFGFARKEIRGFRKILDFPEIPDFQEILDFPEIADLPEILDFPETRDFQEIQDFIEIQDFQDIRKILDVPEIRDFRKIADFPESQD